MSTLDRSSNQFLEPNRGWRVIMYSVDIPPCLFQQLTERGDCAFLAIEKAHHLGTECKRMSAQSSLYCNSTPFSYQVVEKVHH